MSFTVFANDNNHPNQVTLTATVYTKNVRMGKGIERKLPEDFEWNEEYIMSLFPLKVLNTFDNWFINVYIGDRHYLRWKDNEKLDEESFREAMTEIEKNMSEMK